MMNDYNIKIAFIKYDNTGKFRPVLIHKGSKIVSLWRITSKFVNKSFQIRKQYFPLFSWRSLGLNKPSYVDLGSGINIPTPIYDRSPISRNRIVGRFGKQDKISFAIFYRNYNRSK